MKNRNGRGTVFTRPWTRWGRVIALVPLLSVATVDLAAQEPAQTIEPLWKFQTSGQIWSSAVHADGILYFGSDDNSLYATTASGPSLKWRFPTGGRVRGTPALHQGSILFCSDDGFLYCVNRENADQQWRFDLGQAGIPRVLPSLFPPYDYDYMQSSPLVVDGMVFVGSTTGVLHAVDVQTGEEHWQFETGARIRSSPRTNGEAIVVGSWDKFLYCLDRNTGRELWKMDTGGPLQATPEVADGRVFIGSRNPKVFAVDAGTGEKQWDFVHTDGSWVESSGIVRDGVLFIGSSDALALFAFATDSGELLWKYRTEAWSWCTPTVESNVVLIGGISAHPYYVPNVTLKRGLWAVDSGTGEELWHFATEKMPGYITGGVFAAPLVVDDVVYFGALDGRMYAVPLDPTQSREGQ